MTDHIIVGRHGAVQVIRMNRADKKNALTRAMYAAMAAALVEADADPQVRATVFFGLPAHFRPATTLPISSPSPPAAKVAARYGTSCWRWRDRKSRCCLASTVLPSASVPRSTCTAM